MALWYDKSVVVNRWDEWCSDNDVRVGMIGHGGLLSSPDKWFWACLGYLPTDMPRRPKTWVSQCNLMLKLRGISRSSAILGSDSPQSNNRESNSIHSPWGQQHAIVSYLRLPRPTPVHALLRMLHWLHWLRCWAKEPGLSTGNPSEDYGQIRGGCSCRWMVAVD